MLHSVSFATKGWEVMARTLSIPQPEAVQRRPFKRPSLATTLCLVLLGIYAAFFVVHALVSLICVYPIEYGEGLIIYEATRLVHGDALYSANTAAPYTAAIYSPLYYLMLAAPAWVLGAAFWYGRLITIVATVGCVLLVRRAAGDMGMGTYAALGAGVSLVALPPLYDWGAISKGDNVGIAFALGAIVVIGHAPNRRNLLIAAGLCLAALATRQALFAAPLAISLWLMIRNWRMALQFVGAWLGGGALLVLAAQAMTGGEFLRHIVTYNAQRIEIDRILSAYGYFAFATPVIVVCAAIMIVRIGFDRVRRVDVAGLWACYGLTAFAATIGIGKVGSYFNHLTEFLVAGLVLLWLMVAGGAQPRPALLWLMAAQLILLHHIPFVADDNRSPTPADFEQGGRVERVVREYAGRGPVLAEDVGWLLSSGARPDLDDPFIFTQLAEYGQWDQTPFVTKLRAGNYGLIVLQTPPQTDSEKAQQPDEIVFFPSRYTKDMRDAIRARYRVLATYGNSMLLVPKP